MSDDVRQREGESREDWLVRLYLTGLSVRRVATVSGWGYGTVYRAVDAAGELRDRGAHHRARRAVAQ